MYNGNSVGVVIPAYNEQGFVGNVIESVPSFVDHIYVIDDGSTDETWEEIQAAVSASRARTSLVHPITDGGSNVERVIAIQHDQNRGVGAAIKTGYLRARDDKVDIVTVLGGDGQMDPDLLTLVIDPIAKGEAEYVKTNRLLRADHRQSMPTFRYVGNVILTYLTRIASGYWGIGDPQSGYTAISLTALETVDIENMYEFYGYCNDLLVRLNVYKLRVVDVPMPAIYGDEVSHIRYSTYIPNVSKMLFRNFLWRLRARYLKNGDYSVVGCYTLAVVFGVFALVSVLLGNTGISRLVEVVGGLVLISTFMALGMLLDKRANDHLDTALLPVDDTRVDATSVTRSQTP
ncbi:glycosyltransferase family 2 protein [Haladaptatus sp. DJG-WS-42]|uniref:glycosyltransferase family 2 protein n=1 Tax=Haladaptatus sp. DJG-WS-42 TaxID=3120516 RepID=UPI0030CCA4ED